METPIPGEGEVTGGRSTDVAIQPDGKIVTGGYGVDYTGIPPEYETTFALARYTAEGELDPSFGTGGIVSSRMGTGKAYGSATAIAADGRMIVAGIYDPNPDPLEEDFAPALLRLNADGGFDTTFGSGGAVLRPLPAGIEDELLEGMALQADGRILTTGTEYPTGEPSHAVVSRYLSDFEKPNAGPPPAPPSPNGRPDTDMRPVPRKLSLGELKVVRGTASDPDGEELREVQVALIRLVPSGTAGRRVKAACVSMSKSGRFGRRGAVRSGAGCAKRWLTARGTTKWAFKLPLPLPEGRYVVLSRAIDAQGLAENGFSRRDRSRYAFRVVGG